MSRNISEKKIFVAQPSMPLFEEYVEAIRPLWDSHILSNMGIYHKRLESDLKTYLDVPGFSLMVNGHMALELAIQAYGFKENSEVITTPFTFISTTHAIVRNHLKPVFCDVKLEDGTLDETKIEELITERTVAIVPVHVYGNICNVEEIQRIADKYNLKVIYDAAHAFAIKHRGKGIGNFGDAAVFSFHATKVYNTIEGGGVAFSDVKLYDRLYNLKNFGIRGEELVVEIGTNAKMNEFAAIMGLCNLKNIEEVIKKRKEKYDLYIDGLSEISGIRLFKRKKYDTQNYAYFPILINEEYAMCRDEVYSILKEHNIYSRKYFYPLTSDQVCFKNKYRKNSIENARKLAKQILVLPLYENLDNEVINRISEIFRKKKF